MTGSGSCLTVTDPRVCRIKVHSDIVYPADTPDSELVGPAIDKTHSRFVLTYGDLTR